MGAKGQPKTPGSGRKKGSTDLRARYLTAAAARHVHTRSDEECDLLLHAYRLDGAHQGYIGGMLLEKFYNRGWVDYVLLVLTLHRAASR